MLPLWALVVVLGDTNHGVVFDVHVVVLAHGLDCSDELFRDTGCDTHEELKLVRDLAALPSQCEKMFST
jgi:hypothetical protein